MRTRQRMLSATRRISALATVLMCMLLLCGCGQPTVQQRIQRVEEGAIPFTPDGWPRMGDPRRLTERMEYYGVPGLSVAVIDDFQVAWARGYGVLEAGSDEPVTEDTLFHAGSVAKPVSAAAALALVDRGLLDLDEDVNRKLVSWLVPENEFTSNEKVTLRRLLSHSSGLTDGLPMRSATDPEYDWEVVSEGEAHTLTIQQVLEVLPPVDQGRPTRVTEVPGTSYRYSNLGYGVLELLMTDVTGQPFSELMQETVLDPLDMASSTFQQPIPAELRERAATEHYATGQPFEGKRHHFPYRASGGLWTTPTDLARFAIEVMRAYTGESDQLLTQETAEEMLTTQIATGESITGDSYGLGFHLGGSGRELQVMHTGGTWGSTCLLYLYPELGQGAVIMTNSVRGQGMIRYETLLGIAQEYGWPLPLLLPFLGGVDVAVVVVACLFNLLMTAIFFTRPRGWKRVERVIGLVMVFLALPLAAAVAVNWLGNRAWWFSILPVPLILHCLVELLLDYILKLEFRKTRLLGPYLALFYLGQWGLIGYAFVAKPVYGAVTLVTYFLCLGATRYAHMKGVG